MPKQTRWTMWLVPLLAMFALLGGLVGRVHAHPRTINGIPYEDRYERFTVKLDNGRLHVGRMLGAAFDRSGLNGDWVRDHVSWRIKVKGVAGRAKLEAFKLITNNYLTLRVNDDRVLVEFDRIKVRRDQKRLLGKLRKYAAKKWPDKAEEERRKYGLVWVTPNGDVSIDRLKETDHAVVLVHGLDDGGGMWPQLVEELHNDKLTACELTYPNDQSLAESTRFLVDELARLHHRGVERVSIVTHSMGALLAREALTNARYYKGDARGDSRLPQVEHLVMLAPPNHGSRCAKLGVMSEVREQAQRAVFSKTASVQGAIFDGLGEARIDLQPRSEFLLRLNARPHAKYVRMTVVAGRLKEITPQRIDAGVRWMRRYCHISDRMAEALATAAKEVSGDLGDGVVTVRSTRLKGVTDFVLLDASHADIVTNCWTSPSKRVPPAVPVVMARLRAGRDIVRAK